jgi:hypothetical protein
LISTRAERSEVELVVVVVFAGRIMFSRKPSYATAS